MNEPRKQNEDKPESDFGEETAEIPAEASAAAPSEPEPLPEPTVEAVLAAERDDFKDRWLRALADLDNLRKRTRRDVEDARRFALADVLRPLLDVADNFERALQAMDGAQDAPAAGVRQGVELIHQNFRTLLRDRGVEPIEARGEHFDPARHEAVAQVPGGEHAAGTVIDVVQQGYRLGDLVLRPARVVIAS